MNDRIRILEMVKEGKLTPEEGARLLEALDRPTGVGTAPRTLRVRVMSPSGQKVDLNIPIQAAQSLMSVIPPRVRERLESMGLDLEQLIRAVQDGAVAGRIVDIQDPSGGQVLVVIE